MYLTINFASREVLLQPYGHLWMELYLMVLEQFGETESQCSKSLAQIHQKQIKVFRSKFSIS